jgi:hypothetical protein
MIDVVDLNIDYEEVCKKVFENKNKWIDRDIFYTFGASSYIDDELVYCRNFKKSNDALLNTFPDLYKKLADYFGAELNNEIAYPGFHIFDDRCKNITASIHFDTPYLRLPIYKKTFCNPQSFTLLLMKPKNGAGLNVWEKIDLNKMSPSKKAHYLDVKGSNVLNLGSATYMEYELGKMYVHSGDVLHQIANTGGENGEYRVTLQGHIIQDGDKKYMYF